MYLLYDEHGTFNYHMYEVGKRVKWKSENMCFATNSANMGHRLNLWSCSEIKHFLRKRRKECR